MVGDAAVCRDISRRDICAYAYGFLVVGTPYDRFF